MNFTKIKVVAIKIKLKKLILLIGIISVLSNPTLSNNPANKYA